MLMTNPRNPNMNMECSCYVASPHENQVISLFSAIVGFITSFSERSRTPVVSFGETREIKGS